MSKHKKTAVITDTANAEAIKAVETLKKKEQALADKTSPEASGKGLKSKKTVIISLVAVVVLAGAGAGVFVWKNKDNTSDNKPAATAPKLDVNADQKKAYAEYTKLIDAKEYDRAREFLKTMPVTTQERDGLSKDLDLLTSDRNDELQRNLTIARRGGAEYTFYVAIVIGDIYAQRGDAAQATIYYNLAIEKLATSNSPTKEEDEWLIKEKLNDL